MSNIPKNNFNLEEIYGGINNLNNENILNNYGSLIQSNANSYQFPQSQGYFGGGGLVTKIKQKLFILKYPKLKNSGKDLNFPFNLFSVTIPLLETNLVITIILFMEMEFLLNLILREEMKKKKKKKVMIGVKISNKNIQFRQEI